MSRLAQLAVSGQNPVSASLEGRVVLSDEESALNWEAALEAHSDAQQMFRDMDHGADLAVALEGLADVVGGIESATQTDLMLIDCASDLAMAGTGEAGATVTPGLEDNAGLQVSNEGIKSMAASVWKAIVKFVKDVRKKVADFFHRVFGEMPRMRKALTKLKDKAESYSDKSIEEGNTQLGEEVNRIAVNNIAPKNAKGLLENMAATRNAIEWTFDTYSKELEKVGKGLTEAYKGFDTSEAKAEDSLAKLADAAFDIDVNSKLDGVEKYSVSNDTRFDGEKVARLNIMGNFSLYRIKTSGKGDTDAKTGLGMARIARSRIVKVMATSQRSVDPIEDAEISTLTVSEIKGLADEGISIVDAIEGWERGKNIAAVRKAKDKLDDAAKKAQGLFEKEKDASANSRSVFNSALEFTRAFETWSSEPHTTLTTKAIAGVRAAIVISNKSLSNYK